MGPLVKSLYVESWWCHVGEDGVTRIVESQSPGTAGWYKTYLVYKGDALFLEVPANLVLAEYFVKEP